MYNGNSERRESHEQRSQNNDHQGIQRARWAAAQGMELEFQGGRKSMRRLKSNLPARKQEAARVSPSAYRMPSVFHFYWNPSSHTVLPKISIFKKKFLFCSFLTGTVNLKKKKKKGQFQSSSSPIIIGILQRKVDSW